jgi:aspartate racemase
MRTAGILGGAGPGATADFYRDLIERCAAAGATTRPPVLIASMRIDLAVEETLLRTGEGVDRYREGMLAAGRALKAAGADFLALPCNTLHLLLPDVERATGLVAVGIVDAVAMRLRAGGWRRAGLLATACTARSGLYASGLSAAGVTLVVPRDDHQDRIHELILAEIHGRDWSAQRHLMRAALDDLRERGAEVIIAGCTELNALLDGIASPLPVVDSLAVLGEVVAERILDGAGWKTPGFRQDTR